jgi:hypothetical protein
MNLFKLIRNSITKNIAVKHLAKLHHNPYKDTNQTIIQDAEFNEKEEDLELPFDRIKAMSSSLSEQEFVEYYNKGDLITKCRLLTNENFPWGRLGRLAASDPEELIREYAASACKDSDLIEFMSHDKSEKVLWEIANNSNCPRQVLEKLQKHKNVTISLAASIER